MQNKKLEQADQLGTAIDEFKLVADSVDVMSAIDILRIADPKKIEWLIDFGSTIIGNASLMSTRRKRRNPTSSERH